jgi:hypothetical protein
VEEDLPLIWGEGRPDRVARAWAGRRHAARGGAQREGFEGGVFSAPAGKPLVLAQSGDPFLSEGGARRPSSSGDFRILDTKPLPLRALVSTQVVSYFAL